MEALVNINSSIEFSDIDSDENSDDFDNDDDVASESTFISDLSKRKRDR